MYRARGKSLVFQVLRELVIGLADNVQDLDEALRVNRAYIDELRETDIDLWNALKEQTQTLRQRMRSASHLTPASGPARNFGTPAPTYAVGRQRDGWDGQDQGSLFR